MKTKKWWLVVALFLFATVFIVVPVFISFGYFLLIMAAIFVSLYIILFWSQRDVKDGLSNNIWRKLRSHIGGFLFIGIHIAGAVLVLPHDFRFIDFIQ